MCLRGVGLRRDKKICSALLINCYWRIIGTTRQKLKGKVEPYGRKFHPGLAKQQDSQSLQATKAGIKRRPVKPYQVLKRLYLSNVCTYLSGRCMLMALCDDHTQLSSGTFGTCEKRGIQIQNFLCNSKGKNIGCIDDHTQLSSGTFGTCNKRSNQT